MERRNFSRVLFQTTVVVQSPVGNADGEIVNLSLGGLLLKTPERLPVGVDVDVRVSISGTTSELQLKLMGRVARHTDDGIGIQLRGMDLDSFIHLKNIIAYNMGQEEKVMEEFLEFMRRYQISIEKGDLGEANFV